jgi:hypothetical protein
MRRLLFATLVVFAIAFPARADFLGWDYNWSVSPPTINSVTGAPALKLQGNNGNSTATQESIIAAALTPLAGNSTPISPTPYTLTLTLTDDASTHSGTLTFGGNVSGSIGNLANSFNSPTTQNLVLGNTNYTVTIGPYFKPSAILPGIIGASVETAPATHDAPEPASFALAACALPGLALAALRRWRR